MKTDIMECNVIWGYFLSFNKGSLQVLVCDGVCKDLPKLPFFLS